MGVILAELTFEKYGYYPKDLANYSGKPVFWTCTDCKIITEKSKRQAMLSERCIRCSNIISSRGSIEIRSLKAKEWHKNNKHPLLGTKRPQHVLDALKKGRISFKMSDEMKKNYSLRFSGEGNPFYGKRHTEQSLDKMRKFQEQNKRNGDLCNFYGVLPKNGLKFVYEKPDGTSILMRSDWEVIVAKYFDLNSVKWSYEAVSFPIIINGVKATFTPDFYLSEINKHIEVKGRWIEDAKDKFNCFVSQYPDELIEIYDKDFISKIKKQLC